MEPFEPHPWLRNAHLMTLAGACWPRRFPCLPKAMDRYFQVQAKTQLLARCHWQAQPQRHATVVVVHGLEGSSASSYARGIAESALANGYNAIRLNQRNCGGTEELTPTLYHSGLSCDLTAVLRDLIEQDRLPQIFIVGYSMGGNLVLKMAGELGGDAPPELAGVGAVCPPIELGECARALGQRENWVYEQYFVRRLKRRFLKKVRLFPECFSANGLGTARTLIEFDNRVTAPYNGFRDADDYYHRSSALRVLECVRVPTLIVAALDDPMIPSGIFGRPAIAQNPWITVETPAHGGHCAFISKHAGANRFWAEERVIDFCKTLRRVQ